jgi:asparagine synthetase B (glutamine-hydrolysing)
MNPIEVVGPLDADFAWDGHTMVTDETLRPGAEPPRHLRGAVAAVLGDAGNGYRLIRDPLGINKLFWSQRPDGGLLLASRPRRLIDRGCTLGDVRAIPAGGVLDMPSTGEFTWSSTRPDDWSTPHDSEGGIEDAAEEIRRTLLGYLAAIAEAHPSARAFVCLSGGLDSSGIAVLAREVFPNIVAVSFDLARTEGPSEDRLTAQQLAEDLHMPFLETTVSEDVLLERMDTVLVEGVDWRDFNVHAALVNAALADTISVETRSDPGSAIVLTGDLANEFLVDYHPEHYHGTDYYRLPRLDPVTLRASLIRGLDTSHREIGIFSAYGLSLVQPYAVAVDAYLTLPGDFLALEDRKQRLARMLFGPSLPGYVYERPKVRAQIGSSGSGGVLGVCIDRGLDQRWLAERFAKLHDARVDELARFIRAGVYRAEYPTRIDDGHR